MHLSSAKKTFWDFLNILTFCHKNILGILGRFNFAVIESELIMFNIHPRESFMIYNALPKITGQINLFMSPYLSG